MIDIESTREKILGYEPETIMALYGAFGVMALFGVIGNVLSIIVWTRPQVKSTTAILLAVLGFSDAISILLFYPIAATDVLTDLRYFANDTYTMFSMKFTAEGVLSILFDLMNNWIQAAFWTAHTMSTYLTLAITVERYYAVCHPFKYNELRSHDMALKTSAAITIISILYNLPRFWISRGYPGVVQVGIYYSTVYHSNFFRFYETWLDFFIIYAIPLAVITICNTSICIKLKVFSSRRKRMASHQDLSAHQERDNRLTRMLIYVVIEFLICSFIHVIGFLEITIRQILSSDLYLWLTPVGVFFDLLNPSANFVSYITFGQPFRKTLVETLCCCFLKKPNERKVECPEEQTLSSPMETLANVDST